MGDPVYDAIVIGGGPGGSTTGTYLAQAGRRVLLLEKEFFPRFHIGESLLPYNRRLFAEMGVLPKLEAAGLVRKYGAQFHLGNGSKCLKLLFRRGCFTREAEAFQVERGPFDHLLLQHATAAGVEVREGWTVTHFATEPSGIRVAAHGAGHTENFTAQYLIDASGRGNLTGNQEGLRVIHPRLKKVAIFGHFRGIPLEEGEAGGDTIIVRLADKWFWLIPLSREKVSVGCVLDQAELVQAKASPESVFRQVVDSSPVLRERLAKAELVTPMQTTSDFSYRNRRFYGPRLLRVGDAAGFMDPIFSAGVYLAMYSGKLAAQTVVQALRQGEPGTRLFAAYERQVHRAMQVYWKLVEGYYTTPFMELFLEPRENFKLFSAVTALLAGDLDGGWPMRWRLKLFLAMVRVQGKWPFVPRINFA